MDDEVKFKSWCIDDVRKEDRKAFIIDRLKDYIDQAGKVIEEDSPYIDDIEIMMIMGFYKAIIEELGGEV